MVDSIQGYGSVNGMGSFPPSYSLTDDQKQEVQDILSQYDSSNLTADDAKSIMKAFKEDGIKPGSDLRDAITSAGFDAKQLFSLGRPKGGHHMPPPSDATSGSSSTSDSSGVNLTALQSLQSILDQYDLSNLSSDQENDLLSKLTSTGLMQTGNMIDLSA